MNTFLEDDDNIRPPDKIIREKLMEDNRSDYEKDIEKAIANSLNEIQKFQKKNEAFEEEIIADLYLQMSIRRKKFENLLFNLSKLKKFDKQIRDIYEIISPIIESYCCQFNESVEIDSNTYDYIFMVLSTTRVYADNIDELKNIIKKSRY
jgi:small-conductance mechanosensitive channel